MANQELRVGDVTKDRGLVPDGATVEWAEYFVGAIAGPWEFSCWDSMTKAAMRAHGVRIVALPAPAAEQPLCTRCDEAEVAPGCRCPKCGFDAPAAWAAAGCCGTCRGRKNQPGYNRCEVCKHLCPIAAAPTWRMTITGTGTGTVDAPPPPAPPPPRCAPGCGPAQPCEAVGVCPSWHERQAWLRFGIRQAGRVPSDIPPARELRIGAPSWSHATVCGGLSMRRGR